MTAAFSNSRVDELFEKFMRADFLSLRSGYRAIVTDVPTYVISLRYDGISKIVTDYDETSAGMPDAVTDFRERDRRHCGKQRLGRRRRRALLTARRMDAAPDPASGGLAQSSKSPRSSVFNIAHSEYRCRK